MVVKLNGNVKLPLVCVMGNDVVKLPVPVFAMLGVPVAIVIPAALNVLLLKSVVPLVKVNCLVAPSVKFDGKVHVAVLVADPKVHGKS